MTRVILRCHPIHNVASLVWKLLPVPFSGCRVQHGVGAVVCAVACALFRFQGHVAAVACALVGGVLLPLLVL